MGQPYLLRYGYFKGRGIEGLMFDPRGYEELERLLDLPVTSTNFDFHRRLATLMRLGEHLPILEKCSCGQTATRVQVKIGSDGIGFGPYCCERCTQFPIVGYEVESLKCSTMKRFGGIERRIFTERLKMACGLPKKLNDEAAEEFFARLDRARQQELKADQVKSPPLVAVPVRRPGPTSVINAPLLPLSKK